MGRRFQVWVALLSGVLTTSLAIVLVLVYGMPNMRGYPTARLKDYAQIQEKVGTTVEIESRFWPDGRPKTGSVRRAKHL